MSCVYQVLVGAMNSWCTASMTTHACSCVIQEISFSRQPEKRSLSQSLSQRKHVIMIPVTQNSKIAKCVIELNIRARSQWYCEYVIVFWVLSTLFAFEYTNHYICYAIGCLPGILGQFSNISMASNVKLCIWTTSYYDDNTVSLRSFSDFCLVYLPMNTLIITFAMQLDAFQAFVGQFSNISMTSSVKLCDWAPLVMTIL